MWLIPFLFRRMRNRALWSESRVGTGFHTKRTDPLAQILAARGEVVLQPEYRRSTGYRSAFLEAIYQHFGDRAYEDVDSATSFAIAQGWADPDRLSMFGWSAGGFVTAWRSQRPIAIKLRSKAQGSLSGAVHGNERSGADRL